MPVLDFALGVLASQDNGSTTQFVLTAAEAQQALSSSCGHELNEKLGPSDADLDALVPFASRMAHAPISGFRVGAVARGESGKIYMGVNIELPGLPLNSSIHAEQCLVTNLVLHSEESESMSLRFGKDMQQHSLAGILPQRFGPHSLLAAGQKISLLLHPQYHDVRLAGHELAPHQTAMPLHVLRQAVDKALQAARAAYTPYYRCPAAAAIVFTSAAAPEARATVKRPGDMHGDRRPQPAQAQAARVADPAAAAAEEQGGGADRSAAGGGAEGTHECVAGPCMESAAHNPGMLPLQAAIAAGVLTGRLKRFEQIVAAVLLECDGVPVQYGSTSEITLAAIAPKAHFMRLPICFNSEEAIPRLAGSETQEV